MNTIRDRIREIIEAENITPAKFADNLDIGRAVISHILNGRNNASLDVIMKILAVMPQINSDWLLTGKGLMYLDGAKKNNSVRDIQQDLFSDNSINQNNQPEKDEYRNLDDLKSNGIHSKYSDNEVNNCDKRYEKKISKIIIYYTDNTYQSFDPEK